MGQPRSEARIDDGRRNIVAILNPLVQDIADALLALGGAAHRDLVVAHIARKRGLYRPPPALATELEAAFCAYCGGGDDPRAPSLLHLPHGPHSRRWALTGHAHDLLRSNLAAGSR